MTMALALASLMLAFGAGGICWAIGDIRGFSRGFDKGVEFGKRSGFDRARSAMKKALEDMS